MTQLSEHFTLAELCVSAAAAKHGIANTPSPEHLKNIERYLAPGLEVTRSIIHAPLIVTSGYRNPEVNDLVGGVPTSAHCLGFAGDTRSPRYPAPKLARIVYDAWRMGHYNACPIDQLILESGRNVVHLSFDPRARGMMGHQPGGPGTPVNWRFFGK